MVVLYVSGVYLCACVKSVSEEDGLTRGIKFRSFLLSPAAIRVVSSVSDRGSEMEPGARNGEFVENGCRRLFDVVVGGGG